MNHLGEAAPGGCFAAVPRGSAGQRQNLIDRALQERNQTLRWQSKAMSLEAEKLKAKLEAEVEASLQSSPPEPESEGRFLYFAPRHSPVPLGITGRTICDACCTPRRIVTVGGGDCSMVRVLSRSAQVMVTRMQCPASKIFDVGRRSKVNSAGSADNSAISSWKLR